MSGGHEPVLLAEVVEHLARPTVRRIVDGTVGLGGHAAALLQRLPEAELLGLDRDAEALGIQRRVDADGVPVDVNGTGVGPLRPRQDFDQGTLARPILAEQSVDFASAQVKPGRAQGPHAREGLADSFHSQQRRRRRGGNRLYGLCRGGHDSV